LLAAMFLLGAPMIVGPLLAAGLVAATLVLTRELALGAGADDARAERIARVSVGFSLVSAALRYHTADAVPYGAAALFLTVAIACGLRARRTADPRLFAGAGLALGALLATQPLSAAGVGMALFALALGADERRRSFGWACLAALPGVLLLLAANRAATGRAFACPGASHLLDARGAVLVTARRLRANLTDVANFEPIGLAPLLLLRGGLRRRCRTARWVVAVIVAELVVCAPFASTTGDDVLPGAGAQVLTDILPLEHALVALTIGLTFPGRLLSASVVTLACAMGGFAVHASYDHERLALSGLGRPHYEPDIPR